MNNNNCNENYNKIRKKIEECNKNVKYRYIQGPTGPKGEKGDRGEHGAATIKIRNTITGEASDKAIVTNIGDDKNVILDFVIPKGLKGDIGPTGPIGLKGDKGDIGPKGDKGERGIAGPVGPAGLQGEKGDVGPQGERGIAGPVGPTGLQGEIGPIGPQGPMGEKGDIGPQGPTGPKGDKGDSDSLYNSAFFVIIPETTVSGIAAIGSTKIIPSTINYFQIKDSRNITIQTSGIYEITLCGKISGVTSTVGASFYLYDSTNNQKLTDFIFELKKGNTSEMYFSKVNLLEVTNSIELQVKTEIENNANENIDFSDIKLLIRRYNV